MIPKKKIKTVRPSLLSVGDTSNRPQMDSRICLYSHQLFQDNYPLWFTEERLMRFLETYMKSEWNILFGLYVLGVVTMNACIDFGKTNVATPATLSHYLFTFLLTVPYILHVAASIFIDFRRLRLGGSRFHVYGYVLDVVSFVVPFITAQSMGICLETRLIDLAAVTLRMHRPLQHLGSLNYNLTGSIYLTLFKYFYISLAIRIFYAFIYMSTGRLQSLDAVLSDTTSKFYGPCRKLFHAFYLMNKIFIPLGSDVHPDGDESRIMFIFAMLTGVLLVIGIATASLSLIFSLYMRPEEEFRSRFRLIMSDMKSTNLPPKLVKKVETFYKMFWHKQKAVSETRLLPEYPPCLLIAIRTNIYFQAMQKSRIVKDLSSSFLSEIAKHMQTIYYIPGDLIVERNSSKPSIIFINYGEIELLSAEDDETALLRLLCGTILNPCGVCIELACTRSYVAISAATFCIAHVLKASDLWHVANKYGGDVQNFIMQSAFSNHLEKVKRHFENRKRLPVEAKYKSNIIQLKQALMELKEARDGNGKLLLERADMFLNISGCYMMRNQSDMSLSEEADEVCLRLTFPYILQPDSSLLNTWNAVVALLALIVVFVHPYYLIFTKDVPDGFRFFNHMVTIVYVFDIIIHLSTGAKVEEGVPLTFTQTASEQTRSIWFFIHLLSILPIFELLGDGFYTGLNKLIKTPQIFRKLKTLEDVCVYHSNILRLFAFFLLCIILTYTVGATHQVYGCVAYGYCVVTNFTDSPHWEKKPLDNGPVLGRLLYSLYFAISIITFTSDKTASLAKVMWEHQVFVVFLMEVCIILHILIEGSYSATIVVTESLWDRYTTCIDTVKTFLVKKNVDHMLRLRFIKYLELCWYTDKAYSITHEKHSILFDLPPHVHEDILTMQRSKYILRIPFMKFLPNHVLKKISAQTRQFHTAPNEILQNTGDISNEIYVIREGVCEVLDPETKKVVRLLSAKHHFGDIECLLRLPAYYSVRAATHIRLFSISRKHLQKCIELPKIKDAINYAKDLPEYADLLVAKESFLKYQEPEKSPNRQHFVMPRKHIPDSAFTGPFAKFGHLSILRYVFPRFTIRPDGKYLKKYECFRAICALAAANLFPLYTYLVLQFPFLFYLTWFLDLTAYYDVFQRMFVGYFDEKGILIYHPSSTFIHYIKGPFLVDFVSCLPLEYLDYVRTTIYSKDNAYRQPGAIQILMYNRIIQLYRVPHTLDILSDYIDRLDIILMIKALPVYFALLTIVTSLMLEMSIEKWTPARGGWWRLEIIRDPIHGSWIEKNGHQVWYNITETPWNAVLTTFFWVTYETTSTGFNTIQPGRLEMIAILIAGLLLGAVITVYYAVRVISIRANVNRALGKFQEHMKDIIKFMKREKFDPNLQRLVVSHYEYQWDKMGGTDYRSVLKLCDQITLRTDAILHIYGQTFTKCPILRNDISLLRCVGRAVTSIYLRKHMTVVERNDVISEMYIIDRGFVQMRSDYGEAGHITYLSRGSVFGNLDDLKTVVCPVKFMTTTNVHLLEINADKYYKIIQDFPTVKELIVGNRKQNKYCIKTDSNLLPEPITLGMSQVEFVKSLGVKRKLLKFILKHKKYSQIFTILFSIPCVYGDLYNAGFQSNAGILIIILYTLDFCFCFLILIRLLLPCLAAEGSELYSEQLLLRQIYKKRVFKYDVISILPIEVFSFCSKSPMDIFPILRLNRCFRLVKVHESLARYHKNLTINLTITTMASVLLWFTVFVHTAACMWHYIGVMMENRKKYSSWQYYEKGKNNSLCENHYICSVYFIITTFTLSGIGDILPRQQAEVVFVCLLMILSTLMVMIYVGEFSNIIQYRSFRYYAFYSKYLELLAFLKNNRVSQNLIDVTNTYTLHLWQVARGRQVPHFLKIAPQSLRLDIMSEAYMHHLTKHPVFCDCEPSFLRQLVGHFRFFYYCEELRVVKEGEITNSMYFVHKGRVQEVEEDTEQKNDFFGPEQSFGTENGFVRDVPYKFTYISVIKSQVLTLCLDDWEYLLQHFPISKDIIYFDKMDMFRHSSTSIESLKPQLRRFVQIDSNPKVKHFSFSQMQGLQLRRKSKSAAGDRLSSQISVEETAGSRDVKNTSQLSTNSQSKWPMETKRSTAAGSTVPGEIENIAQIPEHDIEKPTKLISSQSMKSQTKVITDSSTGRETIPSKLLSTHIEDQDISQWPLDSRKSSIPPFANQSVVDIKQTQALSRAPYSSIVIKDSPTASTVDVKITLEPKEEIVTTTGEKITSLTNLLSTDKKDYVIPQIRKSSNPQLIIENKLFIAQSDNEEMVDTKNIQELSRPPYSGIVINDTPTASAVDVKTIHEPKKGVTKVPAEENEKNKIETTADGPTMANIEVTTQNNANKLVETHEFSEPLTATTMDPDKSPWPLDSRKTHTEEEQTESIQNDIPELDSARENTQKDTFTTGETGLVKTEEIQPQVVKQYDKQTIKDTEILNQKDISKIVEFQPLPEKTILERNIGDKDIESLREDNIDILETVPTTKEQTSTVESYASNIGPDTPTPKKEVVKVPAEENERNKFFETTADVPTMANIEETTQNNPKKLVETHEFSEPLKATNMDANKSPWPLDSRKSHTEEEQTESIQNDVPKFASSAENIQKDMFTTGKTDFKPSEIEIIKTKEIQPQVVEQDDKQTIKDTDILNQKDISKTVEFEPLPEKTILERNIDDKDIESLREDNINISEIVSTIKEQESTVESNASNVGPDAPKDTPSKRKIQYDPDTRPTESAGTVRTPLDSEGSIFTITHYREQSISFEEYIMEKKNDDRASVHRMRRSRALSIVSSSESDHKEETTDSKAQPSTSKKSAPADESSSEKKEKKKEKE